MSYRQSKMIRLLAALSCSHAFLATCLTLPLPSLNKTNSNGYFNRTSFADDVARAISIADNDTKIRGHKSLTDVILYELAENLDHMNYIMLIFSLDPPQGIDDSVFMELGDSRAQWEGPIIGMGHCDRLELQWAEIQALMTIDEMNRLVRNAGYLEHYGEIDIFRGPGRLDLEYRIIFESDDQIRVNMITKAISPGPFS